MTGQLQASSVSPGPCTPELPLVRVTGLSKTYDASRPWLERTLLGEPRQLLRAAQDVSFDIPRRQTFALVGESGSGKSTVAKMVVGLLAPSGGSVSIGGVPVSTGRQSAAMNGVRRRIQMIFQDPYASLNPRWRVGRIIADPMRAFGLNADRKAEIARVGELLRLVGLHPDDAAKYPHEFSGGQRQRICIARALSTNPEFLVCDEPTSALDVSVQAQILNLMRDLQDRFGLTYLFISHNLAVVRHMATEVGVMYLGRLVEIAPTAKLFKRPRHPYTRMLLDAVPDLELSGRPKKPVTGEIPNALAPPPGCVFHPRCPIAVAHCRSELPLLETVGSAAARRSVACHLPHGGPIGV